MWNFQDTFETRNRSYICAFSISQTVPLNEVKICFGKLYDALKFIFGLSLEKGISPDGLKLIRVTPTFEGGNRSELGSLYIITFTNTSKKTKLFAPNNLFFKLAVQLTTELFNIPIKYFKLLKIICIHWVC